MILYDGTYRLDGTKSTKLKSAKSKLFSWHLRIIDFALSQPDIRHLKSIAVVAIPTDHGLFKTNCAESCGKKICKNFNLDVNKILWVECFPDEPEHMYVAIFKPKYYFGTEIFFQISWRPIMLNELKAIHPFIPETKKIKI